LLINSI